MKIIESKDLNPDFFLYKDEEQDGRVPAILEHIKKEGDSALYHYTKLFDHVELAELLVPGEEIERSLNQISPAFRKALHLAVANIKSFAQRQLEQFQDFTLAVKPGVYASQRVIPLNRVGVYTPGGHFPLPSSLLMGAVPARVAGVTEIIVCSPPRYKGSIHPAILAAAAVAGVDGVYRLGGVQAVGAMAYGTETVNRVDKIVGPGNKYVTMAKRHVFGQVGIDLLAGPSELLVIADAYADPKLVAADLLGQAEHDPEAVPLLVTTSLKLAKSVIDELAVQLAALPTAATAAQAIHNNGLAVIVPTLEEAVALANKKAPEHLQLMVRKPEQLTRRLYNYGSLFLGSLTCEVLGDYTAGINHTLPTNTTARYTGGLNVASFLKLLTSLEVTETGLKNIGPEAETLAQTEGLLAHRNAVAIRRQ